MQRRRVPAKGCIASRMLNRRRPSRPRCSSATTAHAQSFAIVLACCAIVGCGSDHVDNPERSPFMFRHPQDLAVDVTPSTFTPSIPNVITMRVTPLYDGVGLFSLIGHGAGSPIGQALSPITGAIGTVSVSVVFTANQDISVDWHIVIDSNLDQVAITGVAQYDSVRIDAVIYSIDDPRVYQNLGYDAVPIVSAYRIIQREK